MLSAHPKGLVANKKSSAEQAELFFTGNILLRYD